MEFGPIRQHRSMAVCKAAAFFTELFGDYERSDHYRQMAETIKHGILTQLWDEEKGRFARGLIVKDGRGLRI